MAQHTITLTDEQLSALTKLVYMGEWLLNSHRDTPLPEYEDAIQLVYHAARHAEEQSLIEFDEVARAYTPTREFDEEIYPFIEEYDDDMFWEEFVDRMALRDLMQRYTIDQLAAMPIEERINLKQPYVMRYEEIFERLGLDCLQVGDQPPPTQISIN